MAFRRLPTGTALLASGLALATALALGALPARATTASPSASTSASATASASASATSKASASPSALASVPTIATPKGDSIRAREYWLTQYGFTDLWSETTGKGVTVAVIDTGVDGTHQDLTGNVVSGYDASTGTTKNKGWKGLGVEPEHGTLVASVIAGHGHDDGITPANSGEPGESAGMIGVAPDATILPISLELGTTSATTRSVDEQIPDAVRYAVDNGADIINLSVGSDKTSWPESWDSAFAYAEEKGIIIIASAGNRGAGLTQVGAPATMPGVLTVGGVDKNKQDSWSSSSQGISIAVSAPSESMIGAIPNNKYATWSGTSAAAPIVAGLAALIMEKYPDLTGNQVIQRIIESSDDAGADGRDALYGYGIINPKAALASSTPDDTDTNPLGSMSDWINVHRKNTASAVPSASETPVHQAGETITEAAAPTPVRPVEDSGILPFIVLAAFALWVGIITFGSIHQLTNIIKRSRRR
ncbi:S8 family peptidase [Rothia nasimurium]|uniref:S8 family peptidase n=1 Tax=Rothia nasimurium TaxID=85336 RepID=UPI001EFFE03C|nr:S8 family serine peptidase [Rothia nasimurium]